MLSPHTCDAREWTFEPYIFILIVRFLHLFFIAWLAVKGQNQKPKLIWQLNSQPAKQATSQLVNKQVSRQTENVIYRIRKRKRKDHKITAQNWVVYCSDDVLRWSGDVLTLPVSIPVYVSCIYNTVYNITIHCSRTRRLLTIRSQPLNTLYYMYIIFTHNTNLFISNAIPVELFKRSIFNKFNRFR